MNVNIKMEIETLHFNNLPIIYKRFDAPKLCNVFPPHWHKRYEIIHIISGVLEITVTNEVFTLKKDDICFIDTNQTHSGYSKSDDLSYEIIQIDTASLENLSATHNNIKMLLTHKIIICNVFKDENIVEIFKQTASLYNDTVQKNSLVFWGITYQILGIITNYHKSEKENSLSVNENFFAVLSYMDSHYGEKLSIQEISQIFHYNPTYFSRMFKEKTGLSPVKYLNILRLKAAKNYLINSNLPIEIISQRCGFESSNYFIRLFKKQYGCTPLHYRQLFLKQ